MSEPIRMICEKVCPVHKKISLKRQSRKKEVERGRERIYPFSERGALEISEEKKIGIRLLQDLC